MSLFHIITYGKWVGLDLLYIADCRPLPDVTPSYQKLVKQGRDEGLQQGLQQALLEVIEVRFPSLIDFARKKVPQVAKLESAVA